VNPNRPAQKKKQLHSPFRGDLLLRNEGLVLVILSVGDLLMTYLLLWRGGHFYEANPLAGWFFARWNIAGMTAFKFGLVGVIVVVCEAIERNRPGVGRAIIIFGCAGALGVTLHGLRLLAAHG